MNDDDFGFFQNVHGLLARLGVDPHDIEVNYSPPKSSGRAVIALPQTKVALCIEGDNPDELEEDGWHVVRIPLAQLRIMSSSYNQLGVMAFEHVRRSSESRMVKNGSKEENTLLKAILSARITEPDRNCVLRRDDNTELTTPDFAWPSLKLAFYVDGLWWHVEKDDTATMEIISDAAGDAAKTRLMLDANKTRAERDSDNRSELQAQGWRILTCTDRDLSTEEGIQKQVDRISRTMRSILEEGKRVQNPIPTKSEYSDLADLL